MVLVDKGLKQLESFLKNHYPEDVDACRSQRKGNDEQGSKIWLVKQLQKMEDDVSLQWTPRKSGTILCFAGMVAYDERSKGVTALKKEAAE